MEANRGWEFGLSVFFSELEKEREETDVRNSAGVGVR